MKTTQSEKRRLISRNLSVGDTFRSYSGFIFTVVRVGEFYSELQRNCASDIAPVVPYENAQIYDEIEAGGIEPVGCSDFVKSLYPKEEGKRR